MAVSVGAHVVEVSRELHLFGFLAERLPDSCCFLWTAGHRNIRTVMELIPRPAEMKRRRRGKMDMERHEDTFRCDLGHMTPDSAGHVTASEYSIISDGKPYTFFK